MHTNTVAQAKAAADQPREVLQPFDGLLFIPCCLLSAICYLMCAVCNFSSLSAVNKQAEVVLEIFCGCSLHHFSFPSTTLWARSKHRLPT
jgi:hypothetical protein